jgi:hypothetical protein
MSWDGLLLGLPVFSNVAFEQKKGQSPQKQ